MGIIAWKESVRASANIAKALQKCGRRSSTLNAFSQGIVRPLGIARRVPVYKQVQYYELTSVAIFLVVIIVPLGLTV